MYRKPTKCDIRWLLYIENQTKGNAKKIIKHAKFNNISPIDFDLLIRKNPLLSFQLNTFKKHSKRLSNRFVKKQSC